MFSVTNDIDPWFTKLQVLAISVKLYFTNLISFPGIGSIYYTFLYMFAHALFTILSQGFYGNSLSVVYYYFTSLMNSVTDTGCQN